MWYDRKNMRLVLYAGAAVVLLGAFLVTRDHVLPGVLMFAVGISMVMISFTASWMHARVDFENAKRQRDHKN